MIRIHWPVHGAVLNRRHGEQSAEGLAIAVRGTAPPLEDVRVNGCRALRRGEEFEARVVLREFEQEIAAVCGGKNEGCSHGGIYGTGEHRVRVVWDRASRPRYAFQIDDNIFFLRHIFQRRPASIFEVSYLGMLRELHRRYGACFVLNLFFATSEDDFDLSRLNADHRGEWQDNASWLRLSFHARSEFPHRPYQYAAPEVLTADFDRVATEIQRFAGVATWIPPSIIHWAMLLPAALPTLTRRGVKSLSGFFVPLHGGGYSAEGHQEGASAPFDINYQLDATRSEYLSRHDAMMDFASGITFTRCDIVCNNTPPQQVASILAPLADDPNQAEIMDLLTHEQYSWEFYPNHISDHRSRIETAIRFCSERGYEPVFMNEGFLGLTQG